jgi:hypothetical protein
MSGGLKTRIVAWLLRVNIFDRVTARAPTFHADLDGQFTHWCGFLDVLRCWTACSLDLRFDGPVFLGSNVASSQAY